jgi:hypothetical protein
MGTGGTGGGGNAVLGSAGQIGTANTGGGGGGGSTVGGVGGSGVVILRRLTTASNSVSGDSVTISGTDTIHTFTADGIFVA